jgi:hypothetical protein
MPRYLDGMLLVGTTTRAAINAGKRGQRDAEKIKRRNPSIGKCEACRSHCFITPWTRPNSFVAIHDATAAAKSPKKFHIFHERHVWKSPRVSKRCSSAEHSMIAASHPEQESRVMRKAIRQSVYSRRGRQADSKETATAFWIAHYPPNLIQRFQRHFGVGVQKPQNIAACCIDSGIHLFGTAALAAPDNLIAEGLRQLIGAVSARAIDDNNFRPTCSLAQIREKWTYQGRLIKDRNNNGDLH